MTAHGLLLAMSFFAAGTVAGGFYFAALRHTVDIYVSPGRGWFGASLTMLRISVLTGLLWAIATFGATALASFTLGFLLARSAAIRIARKGLQ